MDFKVKALQAEKFVEVLNKRMEELEKLIEELARHKELNEILNCHPQRLEEEIKPRT